MMPPQHGCPGPPQVPQLPMVHMPSMPVHFAAAATHVRPPISIGWQQPPALHELPSQHASPVPPHCTTHIPFCMQVPLRFWPHIEPTATQLRPLAVSQQPVLQTLLAQHAEPAVPHATHTLLRHTLV